jgi:iron complex transport system permease protein
MLGKKTLPIITIALLLFLILAILVSLAVGASSIKIGKIISIIANGYDKNASDAQSRIIWQLRLPRILTSAVAGSILAISGMVYQALFRNPMADPYVLGISSGGAFGVAIALFLGLIGGATGTWQVPMAAFIGSIGSATLILLLSNRIKGGTTTLLLFGVALNFLLTALMTLFMFLNRSQLQTIFQWTLGSFSTASWSKLKILTVVGVIGMVPILLFIRELDIMLTDEQSAYSMGVDVYKVRLILLLFSTLITATTVAFCGVIGFIGLMVPHIMRLISGPRHKNLFLLTLIGGSLISVCSDTIARIAVSPSELPVGIITAIAGSPLFFILVLRHKRRTL